MGTSDEPAGEATPTYGQQVYDALKRHHSGHHVLSRLTYGKRKRLRAAERGDLPKVFRGADYRTRQRFKRLSPKQLADFLVLEAVRGQAAAAASMAMFIGMIT